MVDMAEQHHDIWFDRTSEYSLARLTEDLAAKIIWRPNQTVSVLVLDQDTGSEWKLRRDEHVQQMIEDRWDERKAFLVVDVVTKDSSNGNAFSNASKDRYVSGVTSTSYAEVNDVEGCGDT